ncbi:hypothetical protein ADK70_25830 [Streptomyces rimosus subsp. pseudoverticillatus]|uniref:hypothetical protein n=1 Tax=Streptomyces rimosus TaxID=1927 RepID=UPI0006B25DE6|nr:hypothetical protein [Streptomyces rimosus]KOT81552.1 hypothetical protein ADK70_25830 [Streptomyces rimosus subsp. pseudoverticillatus]
MRPWFGSHQFVIDDVELSLGTPPELWLGVEGESSEERAARLDAGRGILADAPELLDLVTRITVAAIEADAPDLLGAAPSGSVRTVGRPTTYAEGLPL